MLHLTSLCLESAFAANKPCRLHSMHSAFPARLRHTRELFTSRASAFSTRTVLAWFLGVQAKSRWTMVRICTWVPKGFFLLLWKGVWGRGWVWGIATCLSKCNTCELGRFPHLIRVSARTARSVAWLRCCGWRMSFPLQAFVTGEIQTSPGGVLRAWGPFP